MPHLRRWSGPRRSGIRSLSVLLLSALFAVAGAVLPVGIERAAAAVGDLAFGVIRSDATKNRTVETTGAPGTVDKGVAGVPVTLRCSRPVNANDAIVASTTTDAGGA